MAGNNIQCNQVKRDYQNQLDNEKNTEAHFLLIHFVLFSFLLAGQPPPPFIWDVQLVKVLRDFPLRRAMYIYSSICVYNRNRS